MSGKGFAVNMRRDAIRANVSNHEGILDIRNRRKQHLHFAKAWASLHVIIEHQLFRGDAPWPQPTRLMTIAEAGKLNRKYEADFMKAGESARLWRWKCKIPITEHFRAYYREFGDKMVYSGGRNYAAEWWKARGFDSMENKFSATPATQSGYSTGS